MLQPKIEFLSKLLSKISQNFGFSTPRSFKLNDSSTPPVIRFKNATGYSLKKTLILMFIPDMSIYIQKNTNY
jgi:hypothetical protein